MEDSRLVDLFLERNEDAIRLTQEKYGGKLKRIALNILADDGMTEECENDTYLRAWQSIPPNEPRTYLFPYLARITRSLALDRIRAMSREKRSADLVALTDELENCIPAPDGPESLTDAKELGDTVSTFLKGLSREKRVIFIRRYWYMDPVKDIAARFSLTEGKVKSILFRVRNELRDYLESEGYQL